MVRADVTVAIATLDRPGSLSACLDAVLGGSVQPAEIVIVDQSADDRTERAVTQRAGLGAPIKYVRQQTRGLFNGRRIPWLVGTGGNFAIRRQWFERVGTFDARLGAGSPGRAAEDAELFDRLLKAGARFRFDPDVIVYHRRQTLERRLETRWGYGHGIGALCALRIRERDLFASW